MIWRDKPELWGSSQLRGSSSVFSPLTFPSFAWLHAESWDVSGHLLRSYLLLPPPHPPHILTLERTSPPQHLSAPECNTHAWFRASCCTWRCGHLFLTFIFMLLSLPGFFFFLPIQIPEPIVTHAAFTKPRPVWVSTTLWNLPLDTDTSFFSINLAGLNQLLANRQLWQLLARCQRAKHSICQKSI